MIKLEDLEVYKIAMEIGDIAEAIVMKWDYFHKDTLGKQLIRAADSIALNIAEGYGRYFFKENKNFCYYARGSAYETSSAFKKAFDRKLTTPEELTHVKTKLESFLKLLNAYIKSIGRSNNQDNDHWPMTTDHWLMTHPKPPHTYTPPPALSENI